MSNVVVVHRHRLSIESLSGWCHCGSFDDEIAIVEVAIATVAVGSLCFLKVRTVSEVVYELLQSTQCRDALDAPNRLLALWRLFLF